MCLPLESRACDMGKDTRRGVYYREDRLDFSGFIVVKYSQHRIQCCGVLAADVSAGDTTICILNFLLPNRISFVLRLTPSLALPSPWRHH